MERNIKNFRVVEPDKLFASGLPNGVELTALKKELGLDTIIDLSDRERAVVQKWALKNNVEYIKISIDEYDPKIEDFERALNSISGKTLVHCFRGIHRTGAFLALWQIRKGKDIDSVVFNYAFKCQFTHPKLVELVKNGERENRTT